MFHAEFYPTPLAAIELMQLDCQGKVILEPNTWYEWGFFEIKFFKKGTMHVKFKDLNDWYLLNKAYGELKGFSLPETYKKAS